MSYNSKTGKADENEIVDVNISGITLYPNDLEEVLLEPVRSAKGFGRWVYCTSCKKNVKPMLSGIYQIICSECGYKITPDFFKKENLKRWLNGDHSVLFEDRSSDEAKKWLEELKKGNIKPWKLYKKRKKGKQ